MEAGGLLQFWPMAASTSVAVVAPREERYVESKRKQRGWGTRLPVPALAPAEDPPRCKEPIRVGDVFAGTSCSLCASPSACRCCSCHSSWRPPAAEDPGSLRDAIDKILSRLDEAISLLQEQKAEVPAPKDIYAEVPLAAEQRPGNGSSLSPKFRSKSFHHIFDNPEADCHRDNRRPSLVSGPSVASIPASVSSGVTAAGILTEETTESNLKLKEGKLRNEKNEAIFDHVSLFLIVLNTIYLGWEAEMRMISSLSGQPEPMWVRIWNTAFAVVFTLELLIKFYLFGSRLWKKGERLWNAFDCFLVLTAIADVLLSLINASFIRVIRILRGLRAARILRAIGYVDNLRLMVASIVTSFPTLCWACVLLALVLYMNALVVMLGVESRLRSGIPDDEMARLFGSLGATCVSLFKSITGGIDWGECLLVLQRVHWMYVPFFIVFVGIASFSLVGVLTAVIIQASEGILSVDKDLVVRKTLRDEQEKRGHLTELFQEIKNPSNEMLSLKDLVDALKNPEHKALFSSLGLDVHQHPKILFEFLDKDENGTVNEEEFVNGLMEHRGDHGVMVAVVNESRRLSQHISNLQDRFGPGSDSAAPHLGVDPDAAAPRSNNRAAMPPHTSLH